MPNSQDNPDTHGGISAKQALEKLLEGNSRFVHFQQTHPNLAPEKRVELSNGQTPFAVILGCADSRVPPELIFDQGLGDLFVVRVAGHVTGNMVKGSLEYAAVHLHTPLILVLGHSGCGAVQATLNGVDNDENGHIPYLAEAIQPALDAVELQDEDPVDKIAKTNAKMIAQALKQMDPFLSQLVNQNRLEIIPSFYNMATGLVEILS